MSIKLRIGSSWLPQKKVSVYSGSSWLKGRNQSVYTGGVWKWIWTKDKWFTADRADNTVYAMDIANGQSSPTITSHSTGMDMESLAGSNDYIYMYDLPGGGGRDFYKISTATGTRSDYFTLGLTSGEISIAATNSYMYYARGTYLGNPRLFRVNSSGTKTEIDSNFTAYNDADRTIDFLGATSSYLYVISDSNSIIKCSLTNGSTQDTYSFTQPSSGNIRAIDGDDAYLYGLGTDGSIYKATFYTNSTMSWAKISEMDGRFNYLAIQKN